MSIEVMSAVWNRYPTGGGQLLVALALADEANVHGCNVFPSVARIAARVKLQTRSVQRIMTGMVASGWLQVVHVSTGRRGDTNHYRISPEWLAGGDCTPPAAQVVRATLPKGPNPNGKSGPKNGANSAPFIDSTAELDRPATGDILSPVPPVDKSVENPPTGDILSPVRVTPRCLTGDTQVTQPGITPIPNTNTPLPPKGGQTVKNSSNHPTGTTPPPQPAAGAHASASPGFDAFKAAFPRWRSEGLARREWNSLKPSPELQATILTALAAQSQWDEWQREGGRYIPKPSVWLARECWADQVEPIGPVHQAATPLPPPVALSPEQMAANRKRAGELLATTRAALAQRELQGAAA